MTSLRFSCVAGAVLLLTLGAMVASLGCGSARPRPRRFFSLAPDAPEAQAAANRPRLHVTELDCAPAYDRESIIFRVSSVETRAYRYHMWTASPGIMLSEVLHRYMATSGGFTIVAEDEMADLELAGRVDVLEQVVEGNRWHGRIEVLLTLRRVRDGQVLWQRRIDGMERAERRDVAEVVAAQSRILGNGLVELLPELHDAAVSASVGPPAGVVLPDHSAD